MGTYFGKVILEVVNNNGELVKAVVVGGWHDSHSNYITYKDILTKEEFSIKED